MKLSEMKFSSLKLSSAKPSDATHRLRGWTHLLAPLSKIYEALMRARAALYRREIFKVERLTGAIVISIGNLTTGGTGKTPLVALIARLAAKEMRVLDNAKLQDDSIASRICILTRGYGRSDPRRRVVVSDGNQIFADAAMGGDEPRELAERLLTIAAVISDRDRADAARWAQANLGSQVFLLDDGFQHLRLARELDIVTVDATRLFSHAHLLPRGHLRESVAAIRRADLIVITRVEQVAEEATNKLRQDIQNLSKEVPVLLCRTQITNALPLDTRHATPLDSPPAPHTNALAFGALGNPESFFSLLRQNGYELNRTIALTDHHTYSQDDAARIERAARECGAQVIVTTAKDAVKLREMRWTLAVYVIEIDAVVDEEEILRRAIQKRLARIRS